jgi:hypothetical protein
MLSSASRFVSLWIWHANCARDGAKNEDLVLARRYRFRDGLLGRNDRVVPLLASGNGINPEHRRKADTLPGDVATSPRSNGPRLAATSLMLTGLSLMLSQGRTMPMTFPASNF